MGLMAELTAQKIRDAMSQMPRHEETHRPFLVLTQYQRHRFDEAFGEGWDTNFDVVEAQRMGLG